MKDASVVVSLHAQLHEVAHGLGSLGAEQLYIEVADAGRHKHLARRGRLRQVAHGVAHDEGGGRAAATAATATAAS